MIELINPSNAGNFDENMEYEGLDKFSKKLLSISKQSKVWLKSYSKNSNVFLKGHEWSQSSKVTISCLFKCTPSPFSKGQSDNKRR